MESDFSCPEKQKARAQLRETFLRTILALKGKKCDVKMYENTQVSGTFMGCDVELQEVLISQLQTPSAVIKDAILRAGDVVSIEFSED